MAQDQNAKLMTLREEDIVDYLCQHPDFFVDKPSLIAELDLPHHTGGEAISLVERQVSILRERNMDMRHRLTTLLDNARNNDKLFEKTKRLILSLLEAKDINDVIDALMYSFTNDFEIHETVLVLFAENIEDDHVTSDKNVRIISLSTAQSILGTIISNNRTVCGQLDSAEQQLIFAEHASSIASTAIAPLSTGNPIGLLAIGNPDPDHYRSSMNTLFLTYIGEVLSRVLPEHLPYH